MQPMRTRQSPAPTSIGAPGRRRWTIGDAVRESQPWHRAVALTGTLIALASSLLGPLPITTAITMCLLVPAALVDVVDRRLPDRMVLAAAGVGLAALWVEVAAGAFDVARSGIALGALAMAGPLLVLHLLAPSAMGFGDVKTASVAGAALGLFDPMLGLVAIMLGSAMAATIGLVRRQRSVAFGPGLVGGSILAMALTPIILHGGTR